MADKIKLITHLGNSGDLDLDIPERTTFKLSPYRLTNGVIVGEFECTPEQLKEIEKSAHWKKTYIQLRDDKKGSPESANPANNQVHVGTVINPLGFSMEQVQIIDNALLVKPALREILQDNVLDACAKYLNAENLPPKKEEGSGEPAGNYVPPTTEEILAMTVPKLKLAFKAAGGTYDTKVDRVANQNALMDLIASQVPA
jgi:hypothetical protein